MVASLWRVYIMDLIESKQNSPCSGNSNLWNRLAWEQVSQTAATGKCAPPGKGSQTAHLSPIPSLHAFVLSSSTGGLISVQSTVDSAQYVYMHASC